MPSSLIQSILVILLFSLLPLGLHAQEDASQQNQFFLGKWQLGASLSTPLNRNISFSVLTVDSLRAVESVTPNNSIRPIHPARSIVVDNEEFHYYQDFTRRTVTALDPSFWYTASIAGYRQFPSGISLSVGASFGQRAYKEGVEQISDLAAEFDGFIESTITNTYGGATFAFSYHLWNERRFQLFGGLIASYIIDRTTLEDPRLFRVLGYNYVETDEIPENLRTSTIWNNDLDLRLGALYRLTPNWSIGVETIGVPLSNGYSSNLGLEVRYWWP